VLRGLFAPHLEKVAKVDKESGSASGSKK
jgi:hypothetical protein